MEHHHAINGKIWENPLFRLGHFHFLLVCLPEGNHPNDFGCRRMTLKNAYTKLGLVRSGCEANGGVFAAGSRRKCRGENSGDPVGLDDDPVTVHTIWLYLVI